MTKRLLVLVALLCGYATAQYIPVVATSCIKDASGSLIASGTFTVQATDDQNRPLAFRIDTTTGQAITAPVVWTITTGTLNAGFGTLQLADPAQTQPLNIKYHFAIKNLATGNITNYSLINVTINDGAGHFDFCRMNPYLTGTALSNGLVGPTGATGATGPPATFRGTWSSSTTYTSGDHVAFGSPIQEYASLVSSNLNNLPNTSPSQWALAIAAPPSTVPVLFASAQSGVDCTGATDSWTGLNAITSVQDTLTGKTLSFRGCPAIKLSAQLAFHGQENTEVDLGGTIGTVSGSIVGGVVINGCPAADVADAMIDWDRGGYVNFHGGTLNTKQTGCTHGFQGGIKTTNTNVGGYNATRNSFSDLFITPSVVGSSITNWWGFKIEGTPNQEGYGLHHLFIHCQQSAGSKGIWSADGNADSTVLDKESDVEVCYRGIQMDGGSLTVRDSHISGNGGYALFGSIGGGATIYENGGCVNIIDHIIVAESSGSFLYNTTHGGCNHLFSGNTISFQDPDPTLYPIHVDGGIQTFFHNDFSGGGIPTTVRNNALVDGDFNGEFGSQGQIIDLGGNNLRNNGNATPYLWSFHVWQLGGAYLSASNPLGTAGSQVDWSLGPSGLNQGQPSDAGQHASYSPALIFSRKMWNFGTSHANAYDRFTWRSLGVGTSGNPTLALGYTQGAGYNVTPELAFGVTASGMTHGASAQAVTPTLSTFGTPGGTSYSYAMVGIAGCGHSAPTSTATIATGPTTLSTSNGIIVKSNYTAGNWAYDIYRTAGGATTGKIGRVLASDIFPNGDDFSTVGIKDTGLTGDGTTPPTGDTSGCVTATHLYSASATPAITVTSGWGSTASGFLSPTGNDQSASVTLTANGSGIAANPQVIVTFASAWTATPGCIASQTGGTGAIANVTVLSRSTTSYIYIWNGTPVSGSTYELTFNCMGR